MSKSLFVTYLFDNWGGTPVFIHINPCVEKAQSYEIDEELSCVVNIKFNAFSWAATWNRVDIIISPATITGMGLSV